MLALLPGFDTYEPQEFQWQTLASQNSCRGRVDDVQLPGAAKIQQMSDRSLRGPAGRARAGPCAKGPSVLGGRHLICCHMLAGNW